MLRKLSRKISRRREQSPEFACHTAREVEKRAAEARLSFEKGDEEGFNRDRYANGPLEALMLEPIIAPTLVRQRPRAAAPEAMVVPSRRGSAASIDLIVPPPALLADYVNPNSARSGVVLLQQPIPGITVTPDAECEDPFESLASLPPRPHQPQREEAPKPGRPILRRNAISARTQRDLPLRIQAVRRAHQEDFARKLDERPPILGYAAPHAGLRRPLPPPRQDPTRLSPQSSLRRPKLQTPPIQEEQSEVDWYIEAASEWWHAPESPTGGYMG